MATETVNININAKDNASPALKKVQINLKDIGISAVNLKSQFDGAFTAIRAKISSVQKSIKGFGDKFGEILKKNNMTLKDFGEKVGQLGMSMSAAFTLPIVGLGKLVLQNEEVKKSLEPVVAEFKKLGDEFALSVLPVIEEMKPALLELANNISDVIKKFNDLPIGTKKAILGIAGFAAGIGPTLIVVGQVISTIASLQLLLPTVGAALTTFGATASAALAPILPLLLAVGVLIQLINSPFGQKGLKAGAQLLSMSAGGLGGIVGLFNGKGSGATADQYFKGAAETFGLLPARANGGPVMAGQSYIVGERQPEIFTPNQNGYISPSVNGRGGVNISVSFSSAVSLTDEREAARKLVPIIKQAMRLA